MLVKTTNYLLILELGELITEIHDSSNIYGRVLAHSDRTAGCRVSDYFTFSRICFIRARLF